MKKIFVKLTCLTHKSWSQGGSVRQVSQGGSVRQVSQGGSVRQVSL